MCKNIFAKYFCIGSAGWYFHASNRKVIKSWQISELCISSFTFDKYPIKTFWKYQNIPSNSAHMIKISTICSLSALNAVKKIHLIIINFSPQTKKVTGKFYPQLCLLSIAYTKKKQSMVINRSRSNCKGKPPTALINDLDRRVVYLTKVAIGDVINVDLDCVQLWFLK